MIITHFNKQHFKIQLGDLTIAINPVSKDSKFDTNKYGADIVLETINHPDYNGGAMMSYGEREPFIISGPGEYEVQGIFIKGFGSYINLSINGKEKTKFQNTSYVFNVDNMRICFLGCIKDDLSPEQKEIIDDVDILFVPVSSNEEILNAYEANKLATKLEPKLIIPMDYDESSLKMFLKESGTDINKLEKIEKLTIKRKDIEDKENEIIVFKI